MQDQFDNLFLGIAQKCNGVDSLVETFFGFLLRKTDFFTQPDQAKKLIDKHLDSFINVANNKKVTPVLQKPSVKTISKVEEIEEDIVIKTPTEGENFNEKYIRECNNRKAIITKEIEIMDTTVDENNKKPTGIQPNYRNGCDYEKYIFYQTLGEVEVRVPFPKQNIKSKNLDITLTHSRIKVVLKPDIVLIDGKLEASINQEDSFWTIEDGQCWVANLTKCNTSEWWKGLIEGDTPINLQKVCPENSKLDDLDGETRKTVEKMMFDQRQKQMGLPTSEESQKQDVLKKFMESHPEMDFSKAKFS